jgi:hypothetical protein
MPDGVSYTHLDNFTDERGRRWRVTAWRVLTDEYDVVRVYRFRLPWHKPTRKTITGEYVTWCRTRRAGS